MNVLNTATLLMSVYATYSVGWAVNDLYQGDQVETWAAIAVIAFGVLLGIGALFARARIPGGLAIAAAALLGLQALDVHNAAHLQTPIAAQVVRAVISVGLWGMAFWGSLPSRQKR